MGMEVRIRPSIGTFLCWVLICLVGTTCFLSYCLSQSIKERTFGFWTSLISQTTPDDYKVIMRNGFLAMDAEMRKKQPENDNDRSGSTAITAFVTPNHIIVANCGTPFVWSFPQVILAAFWRVVVKPSLLVQITNQTT